MTPELGHFALVLALGLGLIQSIAPVIGVHKRDSSFMHLASSTALAQFVFVALSFLALTVCYATSDFSVATVYENSHSTMPLVYKFTSVWGNHEGSMLLWVLILSLFGALVAFFGNNLPAALKAHVLAVQSWIACTFYLFILLTSNPFLRLAPAPFEGRDLNPILQDIGLAIHPPLLYLGYVGFSISFSFAIAALLEGRIDAAWARWVRPWTLAAWMCLTVGIAMGSYWAYYELGWGGFWFWDPVENASLMPWLAGTALLHSAVVMEKRNALKIWTILLAILAFSLSLVGTFLVRSGVLTSVHTFANDPARGVFILAILVIFIGGGSDTFRLARAAAEARRLVRSDLARRRAGFQQSVPNDSLPDRICWHALSAGTRSDNGCENFGWSAVLQPYVRTAFCAAAICHAIRAAPGVEAWGYSRGCAAADGRLRRWPGGDRNRCGGRKRGFCPGTVRDRASAFCDDRGGDRHCRAHRVVSRSTPRRAPARCRPSSFGLGYCFRTFRNSDDIAGRRQRWHLGKRAHCWAQALANRFTVRL